MEIGDGKLPRVNLNHRIAWTSLLTDSKKILPYLPGQRPEECYTLPQVACPICLLISPDEDRA
jgi:hypothetical protein